MADGVRLYRDGLQGLAARGVGLDMKQPTDTLANQRSRGQQSDVYAMPVDGSQWQPLQILDTSDPNFGAFVFLPDYDMPEGPQVVL